MERLPEDLLARRDENFAKLIKSWESDRARFRHGNSSARFGPFEAPLSFFESETWLRFSGAYSMGLHRLEKEEEKRTKMGDVKTICNDVITIKYLVFP